MFLNLVANANVPQDPKIPRFSKSALKAKALRQQRSIKGKGPFKVDCLSGGFSTDSEN